MSGIESEIFAKTCLNCKSGNSTDNNLILKYNNEILLQSFTDWY